MEKEKRQKLRSISLWALLGVAVLFVIVTSCIVKHKKDRLNYLAEQNSQLEDKLAGDDVQTEEKLKIF